MKEFSNKKPYLSPQLTVVEFQVERGYVTSTEELQITEQSSNLGLILMNDYIEREGMPTNNGSGFEGFSNNGSYFGGGNGDTWF